MPPLDLSAVRGEFPALASGFAFFDNAGGSQTLRRVADRVRDYLLSTSVQLGASYEVSRAASERVAAASAGMAAYVNAAHASEIVFGSSTTQLLSNLALAMRGAFAAGDEIVVSRAEHESNAGPWKRLAKATGAVIRWWPFDRETHRLELRDLEPLLGPKTRLVAFTHASNLVGSIHDVAAVTALTRAHAKRAKVLVDGVAYAPHRAIDVRAWGVDGYVFSLYKVYGPHIAALYGRHDLLEALDGINHEFIAEAPYKLQPGNVNFELCHGVGGLFEYIDALGGPRHAFDQIAAHEEALCAPLLSFLRETRGVRILGETVADRARRVPTVSFTVDGRAPEAIVRAVDPHRVGIRHGDFYARHLVEDLGLAATGGVVRASMVHYNTREEVDRLIAALAIALG